MGALTILQRQLDGASPSALAAMRATVAATVAACNTLAQQARAASSLTQAASGTPLAAASAEARSAVTAFERDMYERKIFDPYLKFASAEDEDAFRKREAERHAATDKALAAGTPQGVLEADRLSIEQLKDAGAHGAAASPMYVQTYEALKDGETSLSAALSQSDAKSQATAMKAPPAADPLDDLKAGALDPAIIAKFRNTGIVVSDQSQQGHGVAASISPKTAVSLG